VNGFVVYQAMNEAALRRPMDEALPSVGPPPTLAVSYNTPGMLIIYRLQLLPAVI